MCWKDLIEIYQNDYGVSGNRRSCEKRLLTFYMLFGLTCCSDSPLDLTEILSSARKKNGAQQTESRREHGREGASNIT